MNESNIVLEAFSKAPRTRSKAVLDEKQATLLEKHQSVYKLVTRGFKVLVVTDIKRSFKDVFNGREDLFNIFDKRGLISLKSMAEVTAGDLELNIVEI